MKIQDALHKVIDREDLSEAEMVSAMTEIMEGAVEPAVIAAFLTALRMKGESVPEIVGAAKVMREKAETLHVSAETVVDTCGTGGDGGSTFNISTAAAFVVAGAGITVAKHGNRAVSSKSGSADVLKCLGVNIDAEKTVVERCLSEAGIGFLFAPRMHGAMKHAAGVRKQLGFRTIFNLLGPLTNPAGAHAQVIGVFDSKWVEPLAEVLRDLGSRHAYVVHGSDGLDEITLTSYSRISELNNGNIKYIEFDPSEVSIEKCCGDDLKGGTPEENAVIVRNILEGKTGPQADIVLLNAAAAIHAADVVSSLKEGVEAARESIRSGAAKQKLEDLCRISNS
jgi:anthranilate phosphoribosyltransferase